MQTLVNGQQMIFDITWKYSENESSLCSKKKSAEVGLLSGCVPRFSLIFSNCCNKKSFYGQSGYIPMCVKRHANIQTFD